MKYRPLFGWCIAAAALWFTMAGGGTAGDAGGNAGAARPVPVTVAAVKKMDVPIEVSAFGQVTPVVSVVVQSRVTTLVKEVKVEDGQRVGKGDPLFVLDRDEFAAAADKAKATLDRDTAIVEKAALEDKRQLALLRQKAISQDSYDSIHANFLAAEATRGMSAADLKNAELQLGYCEITAPLNGIIGRVAIKAGNLVSKYGGEIVTINQLTPIRASFFVPETNLAAVRAALAGGRIAATASPDDGSGKSVEGSLSFIGSQVDQSTGTITLEAEFPNLDETLWPGQYVRIVLRLGVEKGALVVPQEALHATGDGVYMAAVAKPDGTVEMRSCQIERRYRNLAVVAKGLAEGDQAVLDGYLRLTRDSHVAVRNPAEGNAK